MLTLFSSSCYWNDRCFLDGNEGRWFEPRHSGEWVGVGLGWLRGAAGRREWRLPCMDVVVRL